MIVSMAYPTVYMQETDLLQQAGEQLGKHGQSLLIISGRTAWEKAGPALSESLRLSGITYKLCYFTGICTYAEIERLAAAIDANTDLVVAVGGGQCMDAAKMAALHKKLPIATIPTLASTCASTTPLSIIYTAKHEYIKVEYYDCCPVLTLADTRIIAEAPFRYLIAGIGDTLAKWYEAYPMNVGKRLNARTRLGLQTAELARDLLFEFGAHAIEECKQGLPGEAICQIIDVNLLFAGLVGGIGHYTCRGSGAHSFHNGMTHIKQIKPAYHGEIVAYGILCQLMLEQKPEEEVIKLMQVYLSIGLPVSLHDLFIADVDDTELRTSARLVVHPSQNIHRLPFAVDEEMAYQAIKAAHLLGERVKRELPSST